MDSLTLNEGLIRLLFFLAFIIIFMIYEQFFPFYKRSSKFFSRWIVNFLFVAIDTLALRIFFPILAVGMAYLCEERGLGILNNLSFPFWVSLFISILLLDLGIWFQHFLFHKYNIFWRFHKIHHSDEELDFSTGFRFHPVEILISMVFKFIYILIIGPSALMIIIYEIILNGSSIFNHSNIIIPRHFELFLRKLIVTPSMHRIHHSIEEKETNSNFGFNLSIWDKIFGTYLQNSRRQEKDLVLGLEEFYKMKKKGIISLIVNPFINK